MNSHPSVVLSWQLMFCQYLPLDSARYLQPLQVKMDKIQYLFRAFCRLLTLDHLELSGQCSVKPLLHIKCSLMGLLHLCWWCCVHARLLIFVMHVIHVYMLLVIEKHVPVRPARSCVPPRFFYIVRLQWGSWMKCVKTIPELGVPPHAAHPQDVSHAWLASTEMRFRCCVERAELTGALPALAVLLSPSSGWEKCYTKAEQKHTVVTLSVSQQPLQMDFLCILVSACWLWDVFVVDLCDTAHFGNCNDAFKHSKKGQNCEIFMLWNIVTVKNRPSSSQHKISHLHKFYAQLDRAISRCSSKGFGALMIGLIAQ